jgi:hypothetical protein
MTDQDNVIEICPALLLSESDLIFNRSEKVPNYFQWVG